MADSEYQTLEEITSLFLARYSPTEWASRLELDDAHIYRAKSGDYTRKFIRKLQDLDLRPRRCRISADVNQQQRDILHALAALDGLSWSEYCRKLADQNNELKTRKEIAR